MYVYFRLQLCVCVCVFVCAHSHLCTSLIHYSVCYSESSVFLGANVFITPVGWGQKCILFAVSSKVSSLHDILELLFDATVLENSDGWHTWKIHLGWGISECMFSNVNHKTGDMGPFADSLTLQPVTVREVIYASVSWNQLLLLQEINDLRVDCEVINERVLWVRSFQPKNAMWRHWINVENWLDLQNHQRKGILYFCHPIFNQLLTNDMVMFLLNSHWIWVIW